MMSTSPPAGNQVGSGAGARRSGEFIIGSSPRVRISRRNPPLCHAEPHSPDRRHTGGCARDERPSVDLRYLSTEILLLLQREPQPGPLKNGNGVPQELF